MWPVDWLALAALLLGPSLFGIGQALWAACRRRRRARQLGPPPGGPDEEQAECPLRQPDGLHDAAEDKKSRVSSLGVFTVGLSLLASNLSGITLLGYPAEVYRYGAQFSLLAVGAVLATAVVCVVFLPVLHGLRLSSPHEYLELRFDGRVRKLASIMYTVRLLMLLPMVIYVPALAFNQVTGISIHVITAIIGLLCIIFTIVGGLRTVVLTGSLQLVVMVGSTLALLAVGLVDVGGVGVVWRRVAASGRLALSLDPSPTTRITVWSTAVGGASFFVQMLGLQPNSVQRYLAVPTLRAARRTALLQCGGLAVTTVIVCFLGCVLYAKYDGCDPLTTKEVLRADQLLVLMVEQASGRLPGLAGVFLAGILSATMGNLAASLNALSETLQADLVSGWLPAGLRARPGLVAKTLSVVVGVWAVLMVLVVERLGGVVQVIMSLGSVTSGALLGLYSLGVLVPRANAPGALAGTAVGMAGTALVLVGQQYAVAAGRLHWPTKPTSVEACSAAALFGPPWASSVTPTKVTEAAAAAPEVLAVLRLSYLWLVMLGAGLTMLVGAAVSLATSDAATAAAVDPALLFRWRHACPRTQPRQQPAPNATASEKAKKTEMA